MQLNIFNRISLDSVEIEEGKPVEKVESKPIPSDHGKNITERFKQPSYGLLILRHFLLRYILYRIYILSNDIFYY